MATAINSRNGMAVEGDLVQILGESFRDWRVRKLAVVGDWEINPTDPRVRELIDALAPTPAQIAAAAAAQAATEAADAKREAQSSRQPVGIVARAIVVLLVEQLNVLRKKAGLAELTAEQVAAAIEAKIDALK
jgi:hypothetical protein